MIFAIYNISSLHKLALKRLCCLVPPKHNLHFTKEPKKLTSDSDDIQNNSTNDIESNDNSDNSGKSKDCDDSDDEDAVEEVLLVDIACQIRNNPQKAIYWF